ncbi:MAG: type II toxin-antitoxin system death-on-curing family toxin [Planctomycetales bacterium]|nr:type II toxin-antitoxin system death-on-curing family toxin [Planctomycetales bacterium]
MTGEPRFLEVDELLAIHRQAIIEHGGTFELRDRGLLESAAAMPQAKFGGQFLHDGLPAMAGAYLFHLCKNHPFVDGNKRVAVAATEIFIELNNRVLAATNSELETLTMGVADNSISKKQAIEFLQHHIQTVSTVSPQKSVSSRRRRKPGS